MKKTISLQWHNRPEMAMRSLSLLLQCDGVEDWEIIVFLDRPQDKEVYKLFRGLMDMPSIDQRYTFDRKDMKDAWDGTMNMVFEHIETDFHMHLEEDILVGPDVLKYGLHCKKFLDDETVSIACHSHPLKLNSNEDIVHERTGFSCWGWFARPDWYFNHYKPAEDQGWDGKAIDIFRRYEKKGLKEIYPEKRRVKNIGIETGENPREDSPLGAKPDEYTGGKLNPDGRPGLCGECVENECETANSLDGVRK